MTRTKFICTAKERVSPTGFLVAFQMANDYPEQLALFKEQGHHGEINIHGMSEAGADKFEIGRAYWLDFISIGENE